LRLTVDAVVDRLLALAYAAGGGAQTLVHAAIAIIVQAVADLVGGHYRAYTLIPLAVLVTGLGASLAEAYTLSTGGTGVASLSAAGRTHAALINGAIAVVVQPVAADLVAGFTRHTLLGNAVDAVVDRALAFAYATRGGAQALINTAIAVVVETVADLLAGFTRHTLLGNAVDAVIDRALALAHATRGGAQALINTPIAVVVEIVADLLAGGCVLDASATPLPVHARLGAIGAHSLETGVARASLSGGAHVADATLVDLAIAVIIEAVANLGLAARRDIRDAVAPSATGASLRAVCADAWFTGVAGLGVAVIAHAALVDLAVAVVVQPVATDLVTRLSRRTRLGLPTDAVVHRDLALAYTARGGA
jgi:hypothetical protein